LQEQTELLTNDKRNFACSLSNSSNVFMLFISI
jgi:hypothetical protein